MRDCFAAVAAIALAAFVAATWRVVRGPTLFDRYLAASLFGTLATGASVALFAATGGEPALDVALVFVVLASVAAVAFVRTGTGAR